jgi:hypothetical protein
MDTTRRPKVEVQHQTLSQHRIAITTNVKPSRPDRAARSLGSSMTCVERPRQFKFKVNFNAASRTGSCHSTGWRPMTCAEHFVSSSPLTRRVDGVWGRAGRGWSLVQI